MEPRHQASEDEEEYLSGKDNHDDDAASSSSDFDEPAVKDSQRVAADADADSALLAEETPAEEETTQAADEDDDAVAEADGDHDEPAHDEHAEPPKKLEPFEVPTSGTFYQHDDRFDDEEFEEQERARCVGPS